MKWFSSKIFIVAVVALFVTGVLGVLVYLSTGELSTRETGLLSTILTILSVIAAWIVSHFYSAINHRQAIGEVKNAHQENLQTYALKAAEKVTNLSDQLKKLSIYLEEELESNEYDTVEATLRAREERLSSSIHMIGMLKSINDTALSDWQGVIGEQLEEQREVRLEREEELRELIQRMETLWTSKLDTEGGAQLEAQINSLRKEIRVLMAEVGGVSMKPIKVRKNIRREIEKKCPDCNSDINFTQRGKPNSYKAIECKSCKSKLISKYSRKIDDFVIELRIGQTENFCCPDCGDSIQIVLDNYPSASSTTECLSCNCVARAIRLYNGKIKISSRASNNVKLTEEMLAQVEQQLPKQPWPKDTHKYIAMELGVSNGLVSKATKELIRRGIYKEQIDGKLFDLIESKS